jgi:hypothetical protein
LCMYNFGARAWQPWTNSQTMVWIGEVWRRLVQLRELWWGRWCGWIRREIMYRVHFGSHRSVKMYSVKDITVKVNNMCIIEQYTPLDNTSTHIDMWNNVLHRKKTSWWSMTLPHRLMDDVDDVGLDVGPSRLDDERHPALAWSLFRCRCRWRPASRGLRVCVCVDNFPT